MLESQPHWKVKPCPGADHTKESLSFGRQPSFFKGRNQSWFHPLRTPSRPGAAAPGPHRGQRAVDGFSAYHLPAAMHRPPAARCWDTLLASYDVLRSRARNLLPPWNPDSAQYNCHPDGAAAAIGGISNSEPLPLEMAKPCLGADHTKESLSFGKQPSLFKGRNQSWFHPLRTPSRPGAAAPGPQRRAASQSVVSSHTIYRPRPTDRQLLGVERLFCHRITF